MVMGAYKVLYSTFERDLIKQGEKLKVRDPSRRNLPHTHTHTDFDLDRGQKVSAKRCLLASFSHTLLK